MAGNSTMFLHPRRGPVPKPAEVVSHNSHGLGQHAEGHAVAGNIARDGGKKNVRPILTHGGMTKRQVSMNAMGHAHATAPDANPASPMTKEPGAKVLTPPAIKPGMKNRTSPGTDLHELGRAILATALQCK